MTMPPPPGQGLTTKDRLLSWISQHRLATALIGIVAFIVIVSAIDSPKAATETNNAAPASLFRTTRWRPKLERRFSVGAATLSMPPLLLGLPSLWLIRLPPVSAAAVS